MNTEVSAGGIIAYRGRGGWYVLLMKDMGGKWTFPKGKIEAHEDRLDTAKREIEEEVGLTDLVFVRELTPVMYWYFRVKPIKKTVHYYLFQSVSRQKPRVQTEEGISDAKWVTFDQAEAFLGYPKTNLPLLKEAVAILSSYKT